MNQQVHRGAALTPIFVFFGIVALSVVFFFLLTLPTWLERRKQAVTEAQPPPAAPKPAAAKPAAPAVPKAPAAPKAPPYYPSGTALLAAMGEALAAGRVEDAMKLAGPPGIDAPSQFLRHLVSTAGYRVPPQAPWWRDVGSGSGWSRHALVLEPAAPGAPPLPALPQIDLARDTAAGWKVTGFRIPDKLAALGLERLRQQNILLDPAPLRSGTDALAQAAAFLEAVLGRDFRTARSLTDASKVTHEKLAGLCIVFEEGEYAVTDERPLTLTAGGTDTAWAIARVRSRARSLESEIGIELHTAPDGTWLVHAIDFSRMLESYVQATNAGNVFYTPIVKSPGGGESLVVYFEFDRAELHPRALQQLDIVAALLKSDPARRLRITGHSDDLGTADYNQRLSQARAANVRARLTALGVSASQIEVIGFGATAPLDPNRRDDGSDNPTGRSRNRRTEIYLDF